MIKIGMMIGDRYEILEKIGTGGMSDVYKAKDHKLNRNVAVKVLKQEFSENANFVSKFKTEAQAAAGMMHPNIVNVYDVGEEGGIYYIVMELVEGITLKKYIEKKNRLNVKEAISIAIGVSMGIECAHNNHIIHRDIKPQNVMISKDGKVKVTDFGIAKAVSSNTITSNVMGSVHYTSPEQARGGYSDEKSDIYSLGVTLFEMLTGRVPFNGETTVAIAIKHIQEPMPSPREYIPEIPISVEQIVLKCTQKSPDRRYQNMDELISDLKRSLMTPNEDFVKMTDPDEDGATNVIDEDEFREIKEQIRRDNASTGSMRLNENAERRQPVSRESRDRDLKDSRDSRDQRDRSSSKQKSGRPKNIDEKTSGKKKNTSPAKRDYRTGDNDNKAEKITTIAAVVAAIIIGIIVIFFVGRAVGLFDFSRTTSDETQESTEFTSIDTSNVELGENQVLVPDVHNMTFAEAVATLNKEGFEVDKVEVPSDSVGKGNVVDQIPAAGTGAERGSSVTVSVSTGPSSSKVKVPNVIGVEAMEATAMLVESGLQVGTISEVTNEDESLNGLICYQSYSADSSVDAGTVIDLKLSIGAGAVTYSYVGNIESPAVEDSGYAAGTQATVILTTTTGVELKREITSTFPVAMNISGIPDCEDGIVTILYTVTTPGSTTTTAEGEVIDTPTTSEDRSVTRTVKFTKE